jgi:hypothetical protein
VLRKPLSPIKNLMPRLKLSTSVFSFYRSGLMSVF